MFKKMFNHSSQVGSVDDNINTVEQNLDEPMIQDLNKQQI